MHFKNGTFGVLTMGSTLDEQLKVIHKGRVDQTEVEYRLAWSRTYLKKYGLLENSTRGVWALTPAGSKIEHVDEKEVSVDPKFIVVVPPRLELL